MAGVARFVLVGGVAAVMAVVILGVAQGTAEAQGRDGGGPPPPASDAGRQTVIRGTNFQIKTQIDNNYCMEVGTGTNEGRLIKLQQCNTSDTQRFAFTWNNDETNIIVENQGMCFDARNRKANDGQAIPVQKCRFGDAYRFTYSGSGLIRDEKNGKCLQVAGAAINTPVVLADCDETKKGQQWKVTR